MCVGPSVQAVSIVALSSGTGTLHGDSQLIGKTESTKDRHGNLIGARFAAVHNARNLN